MRSLLKRAAIDALYIESGSPLAEWNREEFQRSRPRRTAECRNFTNLNYARARGAYWRNECNHKRPRSTDAVSSWRPRDLRKHLCHLCDRYVPTYIRPLKRSHLQIIRTVLRFARFAPHAGSKAKLRSLVIRVGDARDMNGMRPIVAGEIEPQCVEQVGSAIAFGSLWEVDFHSGEESEI